MSRIEDVKQIIESFGYNPEAPPDPAQVLAVLLARSVQLGQGEEIMDRLSRSVGLYSVISGGFAPLGVLTSRHGVHGVEPGPASTLLASCSTFQSMLQILQIRMNVAQISPRSDPALDVLHGKRRDGQDFPNIEGLKLPAKETEWSEIGNRGILPHPDSLTGLPERLQLIGLVLRNFIVSPRDLSILDDGDLLCTFPAGVAFKCPVIGHGVYDYRWSLEAGAVSDRMHRKLQQAGFRIEREHDSVDVCIDSTRAHEFTGVIGPSNALCPTLRWPTPA